MSNPKNRFPAPTTEDPDYTYTESDDQEYYDSVVEHMAKQAPWREVLPDGRLGPWYGPRTASERTKWQADYNDTREAGSLWDWDQVPHRYRPRTTWQTRGMPNADRYDALPMAKFMACASVSISMRQLEVYSLYYRDGYSIGRVAKELSISPYTARNHIQQLRVRLREWLSKRED